MWRNGFDNDYVTIPGREEQPYIIPGTTYEISKGDIASYLTDENWLRVCMWRDWKTLGDPWGCGWSEWPVVYKEIILAIEEESKRGK